MVLLHNINKTISVGESPLTGCLQGFVIVLISRLCQVVIWARILYSRLLCQYWVDLLYTALRGSFKCYSRCSLSWIIMFIFTVILLEVIMSSEGPRLLRRPLPVERPPPAPRIHAGSLPKWNGVDIIHSAACLGNAIWCTLRITHQAKLSKHL